MLFRSKPIRLPPNIARTDYEFSKLEGCKINVQKSVAFLYTNNEAAEREIKKIIPFTITPKIRYLEINLIKEVKDLYSENYKTLIKETEDNTMKWKYIPCSLGHVGGSTECPILDFSSGCDPRVTESSPA